VLRFYFIVFLCVPWCVMSGLRSGNLLLNEYYNFDDSDNNMMISQPSYAQVSLPHYRSDQFLKNAVTRYKKFLHLKRVASDVFLVPCYDFDLVWHAHQLHPVIYSSDTSRLLGRMFNHDDTVNDRTPGSKLSESDAKTRQLWKDNYKVRLTNLFISPSEVLDLYTSNIAYLIHDLLFLPISTIEFRVS